MVHPDPRWSKLSGADRAYPPMFNVKVAPATHEPPLPRAGEGSGERETVMAFIIRGV